MMYIFPSESDPSLRQTRAAGNSGMIHPIRTICAGGRPPLIRSPLLRLALPAEPAAAPFCPRPDSSCASRPLKVGTHSQNPQPHGHGQHRAGRPPLRVRRPYSDSERPPSSDLRPCPARTDGRRIEFVRRRKALKGRSADFRAAFVSQKKFKKTASDESGNGIPDSKSRRQEVL